MRYARIALIAFITSFAVSFAFAQAPNDELQRAQRKAGTAFSDLQKVEAESKQAEQEYKQADDNHKATQKRADELKTQADTARKKMDAAIAREASARKTYDTAVEAVDKVSSAGRKK